MGLCIHPKQFGYQDPIDPHPLDVRVTDVDIAEANVLQSCTSELYVPEDRTAQVYVFEDSALKIDIDKARFDESRLLVLKRGAVGHGECFVCVV